jgi:hypothetical protein
MSRFLHARMLAWGIRALWLMISVRVVASSDKETLSNLGEMAMAKRKSA